MTLRLDAPTPVEHSVSDNEMGANQGLRAWDCSQGQPRIQQHQRSKAPPPRNINLMSQKRTTRSGIHSITSLVATSASIRMIVLISVVPWFYTTFMASDDISNRHRAFATHPLLATSLLSVVQASTTTMSAFAHPQRKRTHHDGAIKRILTMSSLLSSNPDNNYNSNNNNDVGGYDPSEGISVSERIKEKSNVGNPQQVQTMEKEFSVTSILKELAAIQQQGPQKYCILGTRHCSYLHQQIIELLAYALVLSGNHVYTSGSSGTNAATIRGALRAERPDLLTVVLPQSLMKQTEESQQLLKQVKDVIEMPQNNDLSLDIASRICNSYLLSLTDQLISFAFHESTTVIEAAKEAKELDKLVTVLFLD